MKNVILNLWKEILTGYIYFKSLSITVIISHLIICPVITLLHFLVDSQLGPDWQQCYY